VVTYFELCDPECRAINLLLDEMGLKVLVNVGMNCGTAVGQTIMHCHLHLITRGHEDVDEPRGGARAVISGKAVY
jgi:diadenosine tetraphosphate (Ap4A) HIT family hydrolase